MRSVSTGKYGSASIRACCPKSYMRKTPLCIQKRILLLLRSRTHPALVQRRMCATYVLWGGAKDSVSQIN